MSDDQRHILKKIFTAAVQAVAPDVVVQKQVKLIGEVLHIADREFDLAGKNVLVLGAGKGVAPMALALENILGKRIKDGLLVTKYEHALPLKFIKIMQAAHPVPDVAGVNATKAMLELAKNADENCIIICLFTGGASALTPAPVQGVKLEHVQNITNLLLQNGANIEEINTLRKHLSTFSGGQLVRIAAPAQVISLIISDVIGDVLDVIASGPTSPDNSTFVQCFEIIEKYNLSMHLPAPVFEYFQKGQQGLVAETPKANDGLFKNVHNVIMANNSDALNAAALCAQHLGFNTLMLTETMHGEAKEQALSLVQFAKKAKAHHKMPLCILAGGETTVTIKGQGKGGRNQEMALSAAIALEGVHNIACLFAGTDGTDGPTNAAGGFALELSAERMRPFGEPQKFLQNNNSYEALQFSDDLLVTGPTRTNVMDIAIILVSN